MATEPTPEQRAKWAEQDRVAGPLPGKGAQEPKTGGYVCGINGDKPCPTDRKIQARCPSC